jgi:hypothetical protein
MEALIALIGPAWPYLVGLVVGIGGALFGFIKGKSADAKVAQAGQKVAEADARAAVANTQTAQVRTGEAQANEKAAQAGSDAAQERAKIDAAIAAQTSEGTQHDLDQWRR